MSSISVYCILLAKRLLLPPFISVAFRQTMPRKRRALKKRSVSAPPGIWTQRSVCRKQWSDESMVSAALEAVKSGMSVLCAANLYDAPKSTSCEGRCQAWWKTRAKYLSNVCWGRKDDIILDGGGQNWVWQDTKRSKTFSRGSGARERSLTRWKDHWWMVSSFSGEKA